RLTFQANTRNSKWLKLFPKVFRAFSVLAIMRHRDYWNSFLEKSQQNTLPFFALRGKSPCHTLILSHPSLLQSLTRTCGRGRWEDSPIGNTFFSIRNKDGFPTVADMDKRHQSQMMHLLRIELSS